MAHIRDLNLARSAAEVANNTENPYDMALAWAEIAKASALTDIATALETISRNYGTQVQFDTTLPPVGLDEGRVTPGELRAS